LRLGQEYPEVTPIPADAEQTTYVEAGPLRIGIEYRELGEGSTFDITAADGSVVTGHQPGFADRGFSLHVHDSSNGVEHLRFDAFDDEPHYHYIVPGRMNTVVVFDTAAHGEMFPWALACLTSRLGPMLEHAGLSDLAGVVGRGIAPKALAEVQRVIAELSATGS
jgi:hypothetical protein